MKSIGFKTVSFPFMVPLNTSAQTEPGSSRSTCQHPEHPKTWFRWALQNFVISSMVSLMTFAQTVLKGSRSTFSCLHEVNWLQNCVISSMVSLSTSAQTEPGSSRSTCQHPEHPKTWFRWALQSLVISSMGSLMAFAQTVLKGSRYTFSWLHEVNWL